MWTRVETKTNNAKTEVSRTVESRFDSGGLSHRVAFEVGETYLRDGDRITIEAIRGTADTIKEGNVYEIMGTYRLASRDKAMLAVYTTVGNADPTAGRYRDVPDQKTQWMTVERGEGRFTLIFYMWQKGNPHVSFYSDRESFASVYFGTGDSVLKKDGAGRTKNRRQKREAQARKTFTGQADEVSHSKSCSRRSTAWRFVGAARTLMK